MSGSDLTNKLVAAGLAWLPASLLGDTIGTVISVLDYGALGDGVHDDTAAIQKALIAGAGAAVYFPGGTYMFSSPCPVPSNTLVYGCGAASIMKAAAVWHDPGGYGVNPYTSFVNQHYAITPAVDANITISNMAFDWTTGAHANQAHSVRMWGASNITVQNCFFTGGGDGTAMINVAGALITNNYTTGVSNCAYDCWGGSTNYRCMNNYASGSAAQLITFNAYLGTGSAALTNNTAIISGNQLNNTGSLAGSINIATLATNCAVTNVVIANNTLTNGLIFGTGNISNVCVLGNILSGVPTGSPAIRFNTDGTTDPSTIEVRGNVIITPTTTSPSIGVIDVRVNGFVVEGNLITGSGYTTAAINTQGFVGLIGPANYAPGATTFIVGTAWQSTQGPLILPNTQKLEMFDTASNPISWWVDNSNNLRLDGVSDSSGTLRNILTMTQQSTTSALRLAPTTEAAVASTNYPRFSGAATGTLGTNAVILGASPNSGDTDVAAKVIGKGAGGILGQAFSITGPPTTANIPAGFFAVAPDGSGNEYLYWNSAGTLKKIGPFA